jgi:hypothetical protein
MGKKSAPSAPDLTPQANASMEIAAMNRDLANQQLDWAKEQDANNRAVLERVLGTQLPIMEQTFQQAQQDRQRYITTFQPIEDSLVAEAKDYATPQRAELERSKAIGDVNSQFDAQRRNSLQRLESYGIDPSTTRSQALDIGVRTAQAAATAAAATGATQRVEDVGRALRADAIGLGRGLPSMVASSYGQAIGAGNAGMGNANAYTGGGIAARTSGQGFTGQALQGYGQSANIRSQGFQNELGAFNAQTAATGQMLDMVGTIGGAALGGMAEGGVVPSEGALPVSPIPGQPTDVKPIMATPGEFVMPEDVVRFKGEEFFHKLKMKARETKAAMTAEQQPDGTYAIPMG